MNQYKRDWLAQVGMIRYSNPEPGKTKKKNNKSKINYASKVHAILEQEVKEKVALSTAHTLSRYASVAASKGRLGIALRVGGKIGLRVVPVVGAVMLAHDIYQVGKFIHDRV